MTSTSEIGADRDNNFDALRLLGSILVIFGHAFVLQGRGDVVPAAFGLALHPLGVAIFFSISGYLVTGSRIRSSSLLRFATNRAARILPALAFVTILTVLIVGPLLSTLPVDRYFSSPGTWIYLLNLFPVLPQYELPGVFEDLPYPTAVNGSLWTLRVEFICYFGIAIAGFIPVIPRMVGMAAVGLAAAILAPLGLSFAGSDLSSTANVLVFFVVGALLRFVMRPSWLSPPVAIAALIAAAVAASMVPAITTVMVWIVVPYAVVTLGLIRTPVIRRAARFGDLSYGVYLWAFPAQQALLTLAPQIGVLPGAIVVTVISAACAFVSWHLIEAPALRYKERLPWMARRTSAPAPA